MTLIVLINLHDNSWVCLAGTEIRARIAIRNEPRSSEEARATKAVHVNFMAAQIACYESMISSNRAAGGRGGGGSIIYESEFKTLAVQRRFEADASEEAFEYIDFIPPHLPPSYKSASIRYTWYMNVAIQQRPGDPNSPIKHVKKSFRVLTISELNNEVLMGGNGGGEIDNNPFRSRAVNYDGIAADVLSELQAQPCAKRFRICSDSGLLGYLLAPRIVYRIGEIITGALELAEGTLRCAEFTVKLIREEVFHGEGGAQTTCSVDAMTRVVCLHSSEANFSLILPFSLTPTFQSERVSLKYRLNFVFRILREAEFDLTSNNRVWSGKGQLKYFEMEHEFSIRILAQLPTLLPAKEIN